MRNRYNRLIFRFQNLKYRSKLNLILILVAILPLIIVSSFMVKGFRSILTEREMEGLQTSLKQTCSTLDGQADILLNLLNYCVFDKDLQSVIQQKQEQDYQTYDYYVNVVDPILNTPRFYHDSVLRMTMYAANIEVAHDLTLAPLQEISEESWFSDVRENPDGVWVWPDEKREEILCIRSFPGFELSEAYLGIYCSLESLKEPLYYFQKKGAGILMADEQGQILYAQSDLKDGKEIRELTDIEENYFYIKQEMEHVPVSVYIFMEHGGIYSGFYDMMRTVILVVLICLAVIWTVSRSMSRLLVKKIERLTTCVREVEHGNLEVVIEDEAQDEIGVLIHSFKDMLAQINRLIREVYESRIAQQNLEMEALQAQINPHFLYNTMSLINWKAISVGEEDISRVTQALSDFYRTTLSKGKKYITVAGEIKNVQSYLEIQLMMHDYDFEVEYEIDETLASYQILKLILQPMVENALEHGLDVREDGDKKLKITCQQDAEDIIFKVADNGVGMDEETLQNLTKTEADGYGIKNVNERLALLYGEAYTLDIRSRCGKGTIVTIKIPKRMVKGE